MTLSIQGRAVIAGIFASALIASTTTFTPSAMAQAAAPDTEGSAATPPAAEATSPPANSSAVAQANDGIETIYVTGSAVRRIKGETALPVQTITAETIRKSGVTSVADLVMKLPALQGATNEADALSTSSFGFAGISIHDLNEERTLVLLNGRRLAQFGGQTLTGAAAAFDLNSIPISSIERIEILTDGASALYGSEAIAGVVNFITKRKTTEGDLSVSHYAPDGGAEETGVSLSKGFGDYDKDGWNFFVTLSADKRTELKSSERSFADSAILEFNYAGQRWVSFGGSPRNIPANAIANGGIYAGEKNNALVSPFLLTTGSCPPGSARVDEACYFDYVTQIQIYPERERRTANASFDFKLGEKHNLFADFLISRNEQTSKVSSVPGEISIPLGSDLFNTYLAPLTDVNGDPMFVDDSVASYRVSDLGPRENNDIARFYQFSVGIEGVEAGWDYNFAITQSESEVAGSIAGYPGTLAFASLLESGLINPFVGPGQQSAEGLAALNAINYHGYWDGGTSRLQTAELRGSRGLFDFNSGRTVMLAAGLSYYKEKFQSKPSEFAQANLDDPVAGTPAAGGPGTGDQRFGDSAAYIPYGADRYVWGAFTELLVPITETFETTLSVRYDDYEDVGNSTNYKASFKFAPMRELLFRGSYGTGFKAPTVPQLNAALQSYGVTESPQDCSDALRDIATSIGAVCRPANTQYDVFAGGNPDLRPEESDQATFGFVYEPNRAFSFGADYWWVKISDAFGQVAQDEAFKNPDRYVDAWIPFTDIGTGTTYIAYNQTNINLGNRYVNGIDFNIQGNTETPIGKLTSQLFATYLLSNKEQTLSDGAYYSNIGDYSSELGDVSFRWQAKLVTSLQTERWSHDLTLNYKSGYKDIATTVDGIDENGDFNGEVLEDVRLDVDQYYTIDWQSTWNIIEPLFLSVGALNLLDKDPPLTLTGANFPAGYDSRHYDPRGRTLFARLSLKF